MHTRHLVSQQPSVGQTELVVLQVEAAALRQHSTFSNPIFRTKPRGVIHPLRSALGRFPQVIQQFRLRHAKSKHSISHLFPQMSNKPAQNWLESSLPHASISANNQFVPFPLVPVMTFLFFHSLCGKRTKCIWRFPLWNSSFILHQSLLSCTLWTGLHGPILSYQPKVSSKHFSSRSLRLKSLMSEQHLGLGPFQCLPVPKPSWTFLVLYCLCSNKSKFQMQNL